MKAHVGWLLWLALVACGCPSRAPAVPVTEAAPTCEGAPIAWDAAARAEAVHLVSTSLADERSFGVADAARELQAEGRTYFVLVPEGVTVPVRPGLREVDARPTPDAAAPDVPVWSWQIEIVDRYRDGFLLLTEEQSAFADGRTSRLVNEYCGRLVRGRALVIHLRGSAT